MLATIVSKIQAFARSKTLLTASTAYLSILSTIVAGIFTIPIALRFLSKEEFGLWAVIGQTMGYLLLIDFGVSWSASRMLADPIRNGDVVELKKWWTVIVTTLTCQAVIVLLVGISLTPHVISFFDIPSELHDQAKTLWIGMLTLNAIQLPFRAYTGVIYCQNRWYIYHLTSILAAWLNLFMFIALLACGFKTVSYLLASASSIMLSCVIWSLSVRRSEVNPAFSFRNFDSIKLINLFKYSSGIFLVAISSQISFMSQSLVIGKFLGVGAIAAFAVSSKSGSILMQIMNKAIESFSPRWLQMYIDENSNGIMTEWRKLMHLIFPICLLGAIGIMIFNRSFSLLYGGEGNHVGRIFDLFLALAFIAQVYPRSLGFIFPMSRRIKVWCRFSILDSIIQISISIILTMWLGEVGVLLGVIAGSTIVLLPFSILRGPNYLGVPRSEMLKGFLTSLCLSILAIICTFILIQRDITIPIGWWPTNTEFIMGLISFAIIGIFLALANIYTSRNSN